MLVDVAKVVSGLGALATVLALIGVTSIVLAAKRRWSELLVLVAGLGLVYAAVHVAKAEIDRPRPADPLVDTARPLTERPRGLRDGLDRGRVCLTRRLGLVANAALVIVGIAIAAAVGLSRIYLRAHYWSDVAGGGVSAAGSSPRWRRSSSSSSTYATMASDASRATARESRAMKTWICPPPRSRSRWHPAWSAPATSR